MARRSRAATLECVCRTGAVCQLTPSPQTNHGCETKAARAALHLCDGRGLLPPLAHDRARCLTRAEVSVEGGSGCRTRGGLPPSAVLLVLLPCGGVSEFLLGDQRRAHSGRSPVSSSVALVACSRLVDVDCQREVAYIANRASSSCRSIYSCSVIRGARCQCFRAQL